MNGYTWYSVTKRIIDIAGSIVLMILFFPIGFVVAAAIVLDSKGPVFADTPKRVGKNGRLFKLFKFRSMIVNAHNKLRTDPQFRKLYQQYKKNSYKLHDDPRVTRVGHFIRKHSLDELPQFLNVLKGDMSLVGPRPYYEDELVEQQREYPHTRKLVKIVLSSRPGITGYWQVSGRSEVNFEKRIMLDADYVTKKSLLFDLMIIFKSPWAMISGKGAV